MLFHIHIDAETVGREFATFATETLGFSRFSFEANPAGVPKFAPQIPFTLKVGSEQEFNAAFDQLESHQRPVAQMKGYIEGEQVIYHKLDRQNATAPFSSEVPIPFQVTRRRLEPGTFRESELHVTLPIASRDERLREKLLQMGFFLAICQEAQRAPREIYTLQGSQQQIDQLRPGVIDYLESVGGVGNAVLKEERVARWWMSELGFPFPPVVDRIDMRTAT